MGTTVIGGMLAASAIGIFFVPAIYYLVERFSPAANTVRTSASMQPSAQQGD
jgi:HAE1 family hydrophobic/amphiphilic exporter-1